MNQHTQHVQHLVCMGSEFKEQSDQNQSILKHVQHLVCMGSEFKEQSDQNQRILKHVQHLVCMGSESRAIEPEYTQTCLIYANIFENTLFKVYFNMQSGVGPAQTRFADMLCKIFCKIFCNTLCKIFFTAFCTVKCHLNFATHGSWRSALQSRGRFSFPI